VRWYSWGKTAIVNFNPSRMDDATVVRYKGGYSISKDLSRGVYVYSVWLLPSTHLGNYKNVDDAKEKVAEHMSEIEAK